MPKYANVDLSHRHHSGDVEAIPCLGGSPYRLPGSKKFKPRDGQPVRIARVEDNESRLRLATRYFLLDFDMLPERLRAMNGSQFSALVLYDPRQMPSIPGVHFLCAARDPRNLEEAIQNIKVLAPHSISDDYIFGSKSTGPIAKMAFDDEDFRPQVASKPIQGSILFMPLQYLTSGISRSNSTTMKKGYGIDKVVARMITREYIGTSVFIRD